MANKFESFIRTLSPEQQEYVIIGLPYALANWYAGDYTGKQKSKWRKLHAAQSSFSIDRMTTCLYALRPYYPPTKYKQLVRFTDLKANPKLPQEIGDSKIIRLVKTQLQKPLMSWTLPKDRTLRMSTFIKDESPDYMLTWDLPDYKHIVADYMSLQKLAKDAMIYIKKMSKREDWGIIEYSEGEDLWEDVLSQQAKFSREQEVLVYLDKPIKCRATHI